MNPRIAAATVGAITVVLGFAGLLYPGRVMGLLGFTILDASQAASVLGEVRATYGGLFVVMGIFTVLAALNPAVNRARLLFIGLLWLGACAGRLLGASIDGNPGLFGWLYWAFELIMGAALVAAATLSKSDTALAVEAPPAGAAATQS